MKAIIVLFFAAISSFSMAMAQPLALSISSQTNVAVNGQSTGSVTLSGSGGTGTYQYSKDGINFQPSATFSALAAGNYTFTIRDASLATATVNATITQASALEVSVSSQRNVAIIGQSTGSVSLFAAGGTGPYQYSKDGMIYQASATFNSLPAGNYIFTVKDASLNTATVSVKIWESNILTLYLESKINVTVIGQSTGSVTLSGGGGSAPYQYSKDGITYQPLPTFSSLAAGIYTFTIRDAGFNTSSMSVTITQPAVLALGIGSKTNVTINGQSTGSVTLSGSGGTPPYEYSKDGTTFQSSATFGTLAANNYTFTVKDAAMATATVEAAITEPAVLLLEVDTKTDADAYGQHTGTVTLKASGGIPPFGYSIDGTAFQSSATFGSLAAGPYTFTLKDAASATSTISVTITEPAFEIANIKAMNNFTPNGDGVNDKWEIENVTTLPEHTLTIFDRGGRLLLKVKNYQNDWDGTINGSALAEGTYYYAFAFDTPGLGIKKGFITLIK